MGNVLSIGLGEFKVSRNLDDELVAYGLGSCLGIGMYDPTTHVAGMVHVVLPEFNHNESPSPKYVEIGINTLLDEMVRSGANRSRIITRMAGGANMLLNGALSQSFNIGERNTVAARDVFKKLNIRLAAEEVGGNTGRTVRLYVSQGRMTVRVVGEKEHDL